MNNIMKYYIKKLYSVLIAILIFSCMGDDTPTSVADKFLKAMGSQDFESAKKYGTEETERLLDMLSGFAKMSADSTNKDLNFKILRENIDNDNAVVYYLEEGREGELQLPMVKVGGKWKVLLSKESINNSDDAKTMDAGATSTDKSPE